MNESVPNDDELFRKAYGSFEEEPSPETWENLNARLDKKDAIFYRIRSRIWKRSAFALLLLLLLFVSYEYGFKTKGKPDEAITRGNLTSKQTSDSLIDKSNPKDSLNSAHALSQRGMSRADVLSNRTDHDVASHVSPSSPSTSLHRPEKIGSNNTSVLSENKTKTTFTTEKESATFLKDGKARDSLLTEFYSEKNLQSSIRTKNDADIFNVSSDSNNTIQQGKEVNSNILSSKERLPVDSNSMVISAQPAQTLSDKKVNSPLPTDKIDSSALLPVTSAKKSMVRINRLFKPHWSFSPYLSADFSGQLLDDDKRFREPNGRDNRHELKERENEQFSYTAGIISRYQFSKKWLARTGLALSKQSTHINPQTLYALSANQNKKFKYTTSAGYAYITPSFSQSVDVGDSIMSQIAEQHLSYLTIPLQLSYIIPAGKRLSILPGVGITTNVLIQSKISTEVHGDDENEKSDVLIRHLQGLNHVNFSLIADAEMHFKIIGKWSILLFPSFKCAINPITTEHVVKTYPYNFGLGLGVTYGL